MSANSWSSRRALLVTGARACLATALGLLFGRTAAGAAQPVKPRLLDDGFNARFAKLRGTKQFASEMAELKKDLPAFLTKYFELTPAQLRNVKALPPEDLKALHAAVDRAVSEKLTLKVTGASARASCGRIRPRFSENTLTIEITER